MKVDIKKYLLEITITKKTTKNLEKENYEKVQETSQNSFDKETEEKIKYCRFLKQQIFVKKDNKINKRIIMYIVFFVILYFLISIKVFDLGAFEEPIKKIIELLEFPMVLFLLFNKNENDIQDKKMNYDRICKFIEVTQPLYIDKTLNNVGNKDIKDFYEKLINDSFEENDKDKPI